MKTMRRLWYRSLITALILMVVVSVTAQETQHPAYTQIRVFVPFSPRGLNTALTVETELDGSCDSSSLASTGRPDAWRCMSESQVLDPCFMEVMGDGTVLACAESPWDSTITRLTVASVITIAATTFDADAALPWAMELANGKQCVSLTGATFGLVGLRANYGCVDGGLIFGEPNRSGDIWQVFYFAEDGGYILEQVGVLTAWY